MNSENIGFSIIELCNEKLRMSPNSTKALLLRSAEYMKEGIYDLAENDIKKIIHLKPNYSIAFYLLGCIYRKKGMFKEAINSLSTSVSLSPSDPSPHFLLAEILNEIGLFRKAVSEYAIALELDSEKEKNIYGKYICGNNIYGKNIFKEIDRHYIEDINNRGLEENDLRKERRKCKRYEWALRILGMSDDYGKYRRNKDYEYNENEEEYNIHNNIDDNRLSNIRNRSKNFKNKNSYYEYEDNFSDNEISDMDNYEIEKEIDEYMFKNKNKGYPLIEYIYERDLDGISSINQNMNENMNFMSSRNNEEENSSGSKNYLDFLGKMNSAKYNNNRYFYDDNNNINDDHKKEYYSKIMDDNNLEYISSQEYDSDQDNYKYDKYGKYINKYIDKNTIINKNRKRKKEFDSNYISNSNNESEENELRDTKATNHYFNKTNISNLSKFINKSNINNENNKKFSKSSIKSYCEKESSYMKEDSERYKNLEDYEILFKKACHARKNHKFEEAIRYYSRAIEIKNDYYKAYFNRGFIYNRLKDYDRSIEDYSRAIELRHNSAYAYFNRGISYTEQENYINALNDFSNAIEIIPNKGDFYFNRAYVLRKMKKYKEALENYNKFIELEPNNIRGYYNRGIVYEKMEEYEKAENDILEAISIHTKYMSIGLDMTNGSSPHLFYHLGNVQYHLGKRRAAKTSLLSAIRGNDTYPYSYNLLGIILFDNREFEDATNNFSKAIELQPENAIFYRNRACAYDKINMKEEAINDINKAISLDPQNIEFYTARDKILNANNNYYTN